MNKGFKIFLIILASLIIGGAAFTYGALTAPKKHQPVTPQPKVTVAPKPTKAQLEQTLTTEYPVIVGVLTAAYPKVSDYTVDRGQLFDRGQWYGTTLRYHGTDTLNRDTLRVVMQKKNGSWTIRTTPPVPLLSAKLFPDVPKDILKTINQPISLP